MKKYTYLLPLIGIISFVFLGCSKSSDSSTSSTTSTSTSTYTRSNTPAKSSVAIPSSLSASGSASSRTAYAAASGTAMFYEMLKGVVAMMKGTISSADLNLMLIDTRIADGYTASSTCYEQGTYTITFSQGMYNSLVAMEKEFGGTEGESGSMSSSFKQYIGTSISPPVAYKYEDISAGGYNHQISVGESCSALNETFRWNTAKTKLSSQFGDSFGGETFKGTFTYDDTNKVSTFQAELSGDFAMKMYISLKTCSDSSSTGMTGDCVVFEFKESYSDATNGTQLMSAVGKADDTGGYAKAKISFTSSGTNYEFGYKEFWQGNGTVDAIMSCSSNCDSAGATWTTDGTTNDNYDESGGYDSGTTTVAVSGVTAEGSYLLIETGKTPSSNPEAVLGYGEIRSGNTEWEFWGPDTSITMDVYLINSDGTFTIQSGASVTLS
tara:strand:- start:19 stop:1332 length:1314 start_codon:yes stop_codon:yes gene_type:complete